MIYELFGIKSSIYPGKGCYDVCTYSKPLVLVLSHKFQIPIGKKYCNLQIPLIIINGESSLKKAFIKGIFDSDGNIYSHKGKNAIQLRQKSGSFLKQISDLLYSINFGFNEPYYDIANNSYLLWSNKISLVDSFINEIIEFKIECLGSSAWIERLPSKQ
jgi:intein/homing endonuclease